MRASASTVCFTLGLVSMGCAGQIGDGDGDDKTDTAVEASTATCTVTAPPRALGYDPFYTKYCAAGGIPIVASSVVPNAALVQSWHLASSMLAKAPALRQKLAQSGLHLGVIGEHQVTTDMPENAGVEDPDPAVNINQRTRGIFYWPLVSYGEENVLCYEHDVYRGENILVHELGHAIKLVGLALLDPSFAARAQAAYQSAMAAGRFAGVYAATNVDEYWAEGVQAYFGVHQPPKANEDPLGTTRAGLRSYDPALFALLDETFKGATLAVACPAASFDSGATYRVTNVSAGGSLDVANDGVGDPLLAPASGDSGQRWHLTALAGGHYRLTNEFLGSGRSLDVANDGVDEPVMSASGAFSGQEWTLGYVENGLYRLTNAFLGGARSLGYTGGALRLDASADTSAQFWTLTPEK